MLTVNYHASILRLVMDGQLDAKVNWLLWNMDIVRTRSRMAQCAVDMGATHAFFVDNDVSFHPQLLRALIACDVDFVTAPYAAKAIDWSKLATAKVPQDLYRFPWIRDHEVRRHGDLVPVDGTPFGCTLIKVSALKRMCEHYGKPEHELLFLDTYDGKTVPTVALFMYSVVARALPSEDYAFCFRAKAIGIQPHLYVGAYSPVDHTGSYTWRGNEPTSLAP
jgi:hypothetical protein